MGKISINKIDKLIKNYSADVVKKVSIPVGEEEVVISVKAYLSPAEEFSCSRSIADAVFIDGEYTPEVYSSAVMMNFVAYYTDLKIDAGVDRMYRLFYEGDIMSQLIECANKEQFNFICDSAKERIEHRLHIEESAQNMKINELIQNLDIATKSLSTITDNFSSIDTDAVEGAINKLAAIDDKKIIDVMSTSKN